MHADNPGPVYIQIVSENLERDGVILILEWTQENNSYYSYNVSVTPLDPMSTLNSERTRAQLNVSYNVRYNVIVVATPINCGQGNDNIIVTASIEVHYGEYNN